MKASDLPLISPRGHTSFDSLNPSLAPLSPTLPHLRTFLLTTTAAISLTFQSPKIRTPSLFRIPAA